MSYGGRGPRSQQCQGPTEVMMQACWQASKGPRVGTCHRLVCQGVFWDPCWNFWGGDFPNSWRVRLELQWGMGLDAHPPRDGLPEREPGQEEGAGFWQPHRCQWASGHCWAGLSSYLSQRLWSFAGASLCWIPTVHHHKSPGRCSLEGNAFFFSTMEFRVAQTL